MKLSPAAARALLADPEISASIDADDRRVYQWFLDGMPLPELAHFGALGSVDALNRRLVNIDNKVWNLANVLAKLAPRPKPNKRKSKTKPDVKSLRQRARLKVREVAKFLNDARVRRVVGEVEAGFYEDYASNNYPMPEMMEYVGVHSAGAFHIYVEKVEDVIIRGAMFCGLYKSKVEPPVGEPKARHEITELQDREMAEKHMLTGDGRDKDDPAPEKARWKAGMAVRNEKNMK